MTFRPLDYLRAIRSVPVAELSASDRSVLVWMMTFANEDGRRAFPALETLADASGLSRATVMRATKRLRELGWISSVRTSRTASNEYELHTPAKYQGATSHGATSQSATSHGDTREVSGCNVAKYHGEPLSAQGSAHPPAQFALARSGGPPVKVRKPKKEPKHSLETIEAKTKILATFVESFERVKGVKPGQHRRGRPRRRVQVGEALHGRRGHRHHRPRLRRRLRHREKRHAPVHREQVGHVSRQATGEDEWAPPGAASSGGRVELADR